MDDREWVSNIILWKLCGNRADGRALYECVCEVLTQEKGEREQEEGVLCAGDLRFPQTIVERTRWSPSLFSKPQGSLGPSSAPIVAPQCGHVAVWGLIWTWGGRPSVVLALCSWRICFKKWSGERCAWQEEEGEKKFDCRPKVLNFLLRRTAADNLSASIHSGPDPCGGKKGKGNVLGSLQWALGVSHCPVLLLQQQPPFFHFVGRTTLSSRFLNGKFFLSVPPAPNHLSLCMWNIVQL